MRVLVCGGRDFSKFPGHRYYTMERDHPLILKFDREYKFVFRSLDQIARKYSKEYKEDDNWLPSDLIIIEGGAKGVDETAQDWAITNFVKDCLTFKADWDKYGKSAGYIRNKQMLDEGKPDLVVAFPGGKGTKMMIDLAKKAGVEVIIYEQEDT